MMKFIPRLTHCSVAILTLIVCATFLGGTLFAQPAVDYGAWNTEKDADDPDRSMEVMRLKVSPKAAAYPALRHRLIPDPADRTDGNSAPFLSLIHI